jgi:hypothetical protein
MSNDRRQVHINRGSDFNNVINEARLKDSKEKIDISKALRVLLGSTREKFIKLSKDKTKNIELAELYAKKNKIVKDIEEVISEQKKNVQLLINKQKEKYDALEVRKRDQIASDSDLTESEIEEINLIWSKNRETLIEGFKHDREIIKLSIEQELVEKKKYEHQLNTKIAEVEAKEKEEREANEKTISKQNKTSFLSNIGISQNKGAQSSSSSIDPSSTSYSSTTPTPVRLTDTQLSAFEKVQAFRNAQDGRNVPEKRHRQLDQYDIDKQKKAALATPSSNYSNNDGETIITNPNSSTRPCTIESKQIPQSTRNIPAPIPIQHQPIGLEFPLPVIGSMSVHNSIVYSIDMYGIFESGPFTPVDKFGATITQKTEGYSLISSLATPHPKLRGCMQSFKNDLIVQANGVDVIGFSFDEIHGHFAKISNIKLPNGNSTPLVLLVRRFFTSESGAQNFLVGNDMSCYNKIYSTQRNSADYCMSNVVVNNNNHQQRLGNQPHPQRHQPAMVRNNLSNHPIVQMNKSNSNSMSSHQQSKKQPVGSYNNPLPTHNSNQQSNNLSSLSSNSFPPHMQQPLRNMNQLPVNSYPVISKPVYMPIPHHNLAANNPNYVEMVKEQKKKNLYYIGVWLSNYILTEASANAGPRPDQHQQIIIFKDKNWHNKWPLHYAAMIGDLAQIRQYICIIDGVQQIDPNLQMTDWYNSSPLSWASGFGQLKAVMLLISLGAVHTGSSNAMGFNPKSDALRESHMHVVTFLDDFEKAMARNFI